MAQVKLLKIAADGVPLEFDSGSDDITLNSYSVQGGGPVLSGAGLDMNGQDITDLSDLAFTDPAVGTINQTVGALVINNIMAKERSNTLTTAADILFPIVTDTAGQVDAFRLPALAGTPTATPTAGGEGFVVWDSTNNKMYVWDGATWDDQSTVQSAQNLDDSYIAEVTIATRDAVYISSADNVSPASASAPASAQALGFAIAGAAPAASVNVRKSGRMTGFSSLTPGSRYYLGTTAGSVTATTPTGTGNTIVQVGYAKNATTLDIQFENLGRRA